MLAVQPKPPHTTYNVTWGGGRNCRRIFGPSFSKCAFLWRHLLVESDKLTNSGWNYTSLVFEMLNLPEKPHARVQICVFSLLACEWISSIFLRGIIFQLITWLVFTLRIPILRSLPALEFSLKDVLNFLTRGLITSDCFGEVIIQSLFLIKDFWWDKEKGKRVFWLFRDGNVRGGEDGPPFGERTTLIKSALSLQDRKELMRWGPGRFCSCRPHTDIQIRSALVCTKECSCETAPTASGGAYGYDVRWSPKSGQASSSAYTNSCRQCMASVSLNWWRAF